MFNIYVRDRSPSVRLSGKAYVLPRSGQQGIPLVTVNTDLVKVTIYRIGDRALIDNVLGYEFERNLYSSSLDEIADQKGEKVWDGELKVEKELNQEITTAFPIMDAVPEMQPGVYLLAARPADVPGDDYGERTTQWFIVSDLGLTAYSGTDGIHAYVNSLASTDPLKDVEIRLLARNNEVLATKKTDADGAVAFEPGLARGEGGLAPALLIASGDGGDYAFLNLTQSAFDLTDRGVAGRDVPNGLDAFVFTERGVYRTGETVHVTTLLRDAAGIAVPDVDLTMVVTRPDGVEYRRSVVPDQGIGGRSLDVPIISSAQTGTWRVAAYSDPKAPAVGEVSFLVEDYVPDRLEFELTTKATSISAKSPAEISARWPLPLRRAGRGARHRGRGEHRQGGGACGLSRLCVRPRCTTADQDEDVGTESIPLADLPQTDDAGKATFTVALDKVPASTQAARGQCRGAAGRSRRPRHRAQAHAADRAQGDHDRREAAVLRQLAQRQRHGEVRGGDGRAGRQADRAPRASNGSCSASSSKYQWYRSQRLLELRADQGDAPRRRRHARRGRRQAGQDLRARHLGPLPARSRQRRPGGTRNHHRLQFRLVREVLRGHARPARDRAGQARVQAGRRHDGRRDRAQRRQGDAVGDRRQAHQPDHDRRAAGAGQAAADRRRRLGHRRLCAGNAQAAARCGGEAHAGPRHRRAVVQHRQGRAHDRRGARPARADPSGNDAAHSGQAGGLTPNEEARIVVSAVDVGILNLTNYKAPDPDGYYLGQRKLSAEVRDLYGQLIDGMQGTKGEIRSGGDGGEGELQGSPPAQPPLAFYSGIVTVGPDGTAEVNFDIPAFSGTVRVMAVAWSKDKIGHASGDVVVRDPVVVTATLPRFLLMGDKSTLRLDLDNVEGATGDYQDRRHRRRAVERRRRRPDAHTRRQEARRGDAPRHRRPASAPALVARHRQRPRRLHAGARISALGAAGDADPGAPHGEAARAGPKHHACPAMCSPISCPAPASVSLSVTPSAALDVASLLAALDRYPLGCTEQIVSRAMPLLYVNELSRDAQLAVDTGVDERIAKAIETVLARQGSEGAFGLWSPGGDDAWLDAYVTDFLPGRAARGFSVPDDQFKLALNRLHNYVSTAPDVSTDGGLALAYALYVLARNGMAPVGDLRYIADIKIERSGDPDGEGRDRRGARHARRPRPGREGVRRRARRAAAAIRRSRAAAPITARRCATPRWWSRWPPKAMRPS